MEPLDPLPADAILTNRKRLIEALRSGNYVQAFGTTNIYHSPDGKKATCALGVWFDINETDDHLYCKASYSLGVSATTIWCMNDSNASFEEIAAFLEQEPISPTYSS